MTAAQKALSALSLAKRAGKLVTGFDAVMKSARKGETGLVVISCGASEKTKKEAEFYCARAGVRLLEAPFSLEDAQQVFQKRIGVFGLTDPGFQNMLEQLC